MFTPEALFIRAIDYLRLAVEKPSPENLFEAAAKLRQLFADANPLIHQVNRSYRIKLKFRVSSYTKPFGEPPDKLVTLDGFMSWPVAFIEGQWFTVIDHIRYVANYAGAIHKNKPNDEASETLEAWANQLHIGGMPSALYALRPICEIAIDGCEPLYAAIKEKTGPG